ncbi:hypothetical protein LA66_07060 [Aureimonas altamirensis]|uniref:Uncharacterized protein n=1 Tax=Aureimonas altamirensis TaxID=370622 RepID=A0A0B1Q638_9HYPH|nr:baseplate J/gp47 family protein [Aureimonas altamirensis]KHJ56308.1 hypothetical protein LA66_07060 [Aureimonas altamirensis]
MAFETRSLNDLGASVRGMFRQYLPGTDASLRQNFIAVCAKVVAMLAREYELRLAWIFNQLFLTTATDLGIVRMHAAEYQIFQKAASPSSGFVEGEGAPSTTYPAGVRFLSAGVTFVTTAPFTSDAIGRFIAPVSSEASGRASNRDAGSTLSLVDAALFPTIASVVTVGEAGIGGGADIEDIESLRRRALFRKASPPQGGALTDYEHIALAVPGVIAGWARQFENGLGTVGVWVLFADRPSGIPTEADLEAVQAALVARRLIRGRFFAIAPVAVAVDLEIELQPDTINTRASVAEALGRFFDPTAPGSKIRPGLPDEPFVLTEAWLSEAISAADGEANHTLVKPSAALTFGNGQLPVLGSITWR